MNVSESDHRVTTERGTIDVSGPDITSVKGKMKMSLHKVFPIHLTQGAQAEAEEIVRAFVPRGPEVEQGTESFRVYRDPAQPDYLLFIEHFADQVAYDAHTTSAAYEELIRGRFGKLLVEFVELDHELIVSVP